MARLLLGVSGGIAAYKAVELTRLAMAAGHSVRVVQTEASLRFVGRATFEGITGAPVLVEEFEPDPARGAFPGDPAPDHAAISHLELVRRADAFVIAPASANTLAKLAGGHADNLLSSAALACTAPLVLAPAMNNHMWEHPATRANVETLRLRGAAIVEPETGPLASRGEWGAGRLAEPATVLARVEVGARRAARESLAGLRVLVTAGGTREPIDSVRYVGNRSSGRMGVALAAEAAARGAEVTLVGANLAVPVPAGVRALAVETAAQLRGRGRGRVRQRGCAADGRRRGRLPARRARRRQDHEDGARRSHGRARAHRRRAGRRVGPPRRPSDAGGLRRRARPGRQRARPRQARAQGPGRRGAQRHRPHRHRLRHRGQRGHADHRKRRAAVPMGSKRAVAAVILDEVERLRTAQGTRS